MVKPIENARELLINEGRRLLLQKSYTELNVREIAKNCEIGTGTFYNYFKTKDELVSAIFQQDWSKTLAILDTLNITSMTMKEKFRVLYDSMVEFLDKYIDTFYEISMSSSQKRCPEESNGFGILYEKSREFVETEKIQQSTFFQSELDSQELSILILSNLIYLCKTRYTTFDRLYDSLLL